MSNSSAYTLARDLQELQQMYMDREETQPQAIRAGHWCSGCAWAINAGATIVCPFVIGTCVRIPGTIMIPNTEMRSVQDMRNELQRLKIQEKIAQLKLAASAEGTVQAADEANETPETE